MKVKNEIKRIIIIIVTSIIIMIKLAIKTKKIEKEEKRWKKIRGSTYFMWSQIRRQNRLCILF